MASCLFLSVNAIADVSPVERMESLVMPGKVIRGHARFESKCSKCHEVFNKRHQNTLCRSCHEQIDVDIKKQVHFHGKIFNVDKRECHSCHTDHQGRDADIIQLDEEMFDHGRTNFKLAGDHVSLTCKSCHKRSDFYRLKKHDCIVCHEDDDSHKERMGEKCDNCHIEDGWLPAYFNHTKTDFPLRNNHLDVGCQYCHVNERYQETPKNCYFCHYLDDVHVGNRGIKCHECHDDERWSRIEFDHDEDTEYKLNHSHRKLLCEDCHEGDVFEDELKTSCHSCHKKHDTHYGQYGKKCGSCHSEKHWREVIFEHDKDTDFKLRGEHKDLSCTACHRGNMFDEEVDSECAECHKLDDAHAGQVGDKCSSCHNEESWIKKVVFDHDLTKFPLHGSHPLLSCEDCHASRRFQDAKIICDACHKKDDIHERKLGKNCEICHSASDWLIWSFDHDDTDYPLDGAHDGLDCHACHDEAVVDEIELPTNCYGCHENDDNHSGQLGKRCEKCHVTKSFKDIEIN